MNASKLRSRESVTTDRCICDGSREQKGWLRLPVAPANNLQCRCCLRSFDDPVLPAAGENNEILTVQEAYEEVQKHAGRGESLQGVMAAGPGESLANAATYVLLRQLNWNFPDIALAISTNGLLLRDRLEQVVASGVRVVSIAINAFSPQTAGRMYSWILYKGRRYPAEHSSSFLLQNQWTGLMLAVDAGLSVAVNTTLVPGINDHEIPRIAEKAGTLGARSMQIVPLAPRMEFSNLVAPDETALAGLRDSCGRFVPQM